MENKIFVDHGKSVLVSSKSIRDGEIRFYRYYQPRGLKTEFISHWHSEYEIIYVADRYLDFLVDGQLYHLLPGQVLLIHRDTIHGHANLLTDYGSYTAFAFGEEFLFPNSDSCLYKRFYTPFLLGEKTFSGQITGADEGEREILSAVKDLLSLSADIETNALSIHIRLLQIFDVVSRRPAVPIPSSDLKKRYRMNAALYYINQNFMNNLSIEEIAGFLYMNTDYFRRVFQSVIGCSPKEYILNLRIQYAINEMISHPENTLSEIAIKSGFSEINYFSRLFRIKTGMSPTEYKSRKMHGTDAKEK